MSCYWSTKISDLLYENTSTVSEISDSAFSEKTFIFFFLQFFNTLEMTQVFENQIQQAIKIDHIDSEIESESDDEIHEETGTFVPLLADEDYEICDTYPFPIRKIKTQRVIKESVQNTTGYVQCKLNGKTFHKHRLIAQQFIPNPESLPCVDHIDNNRCNNQLSNLRWVTVSQNNYNRYGNYGDEYTFVDEIPSEAIVVKTYSKWTFEDLYFHEDEFYFFNGIRYRKLNIIESKTGSLCVNVIDTDGKYRKIYYSRFKKEYGLI